MATIEFNSLANVHRTGHMAGASRERGVVLIIALIVLVAMSLAAVALTRSVDIANIAAGNLTFKKGALSATDRGIANAVSKFLPAGTLFNNNDANVAGDNYFAIIQATDDRGIPNQLLAATPTCDTAPPAGASWYAATRECVRFLIDRQCTQAGPWDSSHCAVAEKPGAGGGTAGATQTGATSVPLFRVTVRVDGPRNTTSFSQAIFRP
jgi:Tfp pilus assembly protein PilX